jgi:hypothetical protein
MRRWCLLTLVACSSSNPIADDIAVDARVPTFDATVDVGAFPEAATVDEGPAFNGGGPFLCGNCICDGTLYYCGGGGGGLAPLDLDAGDGGDADADAADACTPNGCIEFPIQCLPKPTCECVLGPHPGLCYCTVDPSGNGLFIGCPAPP